MEFRTVILSEGVLIHMSKRIDSSRITDLVLGKLPPEEALKVLDEVERNPEASREVELAVQMLNFARGEGAEEFASQEAAATAKVKLRRRWWDVVPGWIRAPRLVYAMAAVSVVVVLGIVTRYFVVPRDVIPDAGGEWIEWATVRFPESVDLLTAQETFRDGGNLAAYDKLTRYLRVHPDDPLRGEVRYNAALLCFDLGREEVAGILVSYDTVWISRGLGILDMVVEDTSSVALVEGARILRAMGLIAVGRGAEAEADLRIVSDLRGPHEAEARKLLQKIGSR